MNPTLDLKVRYKLHPAIGIARLGNSPTQICLAPEVAGQLPILCQADGTPILDKSGKEQTTTQFKDDQNRILRQAARFKVFAYDQESPDGRELKKGDLIVGQGTSGKLVDIEWTVWMANKKSSWYQFKQLQGEHGYAPDHPLRNADVVGEDRQKLIINPGPITLHSVGSNTKASLAKDPNAHYAQTFPPPLQPHSISSLGDVNVLESTEGHFRLIVRGGFGNSGSYKNGPQDPIIHEYANNDGWFDDISDGPVTAKLMYQDELDGGQIRYQVVHDPAWILTGYPSYAPEIQDMVTMEDLLRDLFIREFAYDTALYGRGKFDPPETVDTDNEVALTLWRDDLRKQYNPNYYPYFYRDIWPILSRPFYMQFTTAVLGVSNVAHDTSSRGDFDPNKLSVPPKIQADGSANDPFRSFRVYLYQMLRRPGEENQADNLRGRWEVPVEPGSGQKQVGFGNHLMPLLCGDNPISNDLPSKFFRLTDTQLFFLKQWAAGKFINEKEEGIDPASIATKDSGQQITQGVLSHAMGGSFCPGAETCWIIRNPKIWAKPYRLKIDPLYIPNLTSRTVGTTPGLTKEFLPQELSTEDNINTGVQPGDLTKYSAVPWQSDFNECTLQPINVTYDLWNELYPDALANSATTPDSQTLQTLWWPAHRPQQVYQQVVTYDAKGNPQYAQAQVDWARGIPQTLQGDLKMVSDWYKLGFVISNPVQSQVGNAAFIETESQV